MKRQSSNQMELPSRDSELAVLGRLNLFTNYKLGQSWAGRSGGRFYVYNDTGGRVDLRQYFERKLSDNFLFRARTRLQWFEEHIGVFPEQRFSIYQKSDRKSAIVYEAFVEKIPGEDTPFDREDITNPKRNYTHLDMRYISAQYQVAVFFR